MPVTVHPSENLASLIYRAGYKPPENANDVLNLVYPDRESYIWARAKLSEAERERYLDDMPRTARGKMLLNLGLLQSSLDDDLPPGLRPNRNGLFAAVHAAYSRHHHLIIRPDDIWAAITLQLSFYINAHAEELRCSFVPHKGKQELKITYGCGDRHSLDYGYFVRDITGLMEERLVYPELREWFLPGFSTTTTHDKIVASVILMSSMRKFFDFTCEIACGLPSVTLLGTRSDYELIERRLEKLSSWGEETICFRDMLVPIVSRLVHTFDEPDSYDTKDFWARILKHERNGSGPTWYSGWITAFCCWSDKGERVYGDTLDRQSTPTPGISTVDERLCMDGVLYHKLTKRSIPSGLCTVPVKVIDNGEELNTEMVAGFLGYSCTSSGGATENGEIGLDTMQPHTGWFIYEKADMMSL